MTLDLSDRTTNDVTIVDLDGKMNTSTSPDADAYLSHLIVGGSNKLLLNMLGVDYISSSSADPSGYGTLGVSGGDGKMLIGNPAHVLLVDTTISQNLNQAPSYYGYIVDSPAEPDAGWDYVDGYEVIVSKAAFGAAGFGGVTGLVTALQGAGGVKADAGQAGGADDLFASVVLAGGIALFAFASQVGFLVQHGDNSRDQ